MLVNPFTSEYRLLINIHNVLYSPFVNNNKLINIIWLEYKYYVQRITYKNRFYLIYRIMHLYSRYINNLMQKSLWANCKNKVHYAKYSDKKIIRCNVSYIQSCSLFIDTFNNNIFFNTWYLCFERYYFWHPISLSKSKNP